MNKLAVITGASSGIGEAFARELAKRNYDLLLVARRGERLKALSNELSTQNNIQVEIKEIDLSKPEQINQLVEMLKLKRVHWLINNAGFGINKPFTQIKSQDLHDMIHVHILATTMLCHAVLPKMVERDQGAIINVASIAAFVPVSGSSVYPGSKAYLVSFSESLKRGTESKNIHIQALCPGYTKSEFHDTLAYENFNRKSIPKCLWMSAHEVVASSLKNLNGKKVIHIPGRMNKILLHLMRNPLTATLLWSVQKRKRKF